MTNFLELKYLSDFIQYRLEQHFNSEKDKPNPEIPDINDWNLHIPNFIKKAKLDKEEKLLLLLALSPHIQSNFLDGIIQNKLTSTGDFPQLGGVRGKNFRGFLPTGETALFLLGDNDFEKRKKIQGFFSSEHFFGKHHILWLEDPPEGEPRMSGKIVVSQEYVEIMTLGEANKPNFSMKFPAQVIETEMEWKDLVLPEGTLNQVKELQTWIDHGDTLLNDWGMRKKLKPGYRVLFHGPPGTGKTLTASLLGKYTGKDVYKIDLSMVVSKFIGETEKNLANLLTKAEKTGNILFFDEADALFGKRTNVRDAHDKYANQEVSYLLQRIETYNGLVILASNLKSNIDESFVRRFQAIIHFPMPKFSERKILWKNAFPKKIRLHKDVDIVQVAQKYELSGAEIMNIVQYACLCALKDKKKTIYMNYITNGIKREYEKGGRIMR
ncbi:ATP-binding protein [Galbibacter sp. EGI 63066]|uniref:ATP-binding protein n=1 Tax=Galbibacter sp. EGI 63066 TaxID=2993559 RepID=UPI002248B6CD|nr:ATP-binding protein [Galbibacter sp. EGI 63066]MCX2680334.1 ATP-binding protein [Galbibacter sp. EGI 63066]